MSETFFRPIFAENLALVYFLGMCSLLATPIRLLQALALGLSLVVLMVVAVPLNQFLLQWLLAPGAWASFPDLDLSFLRILLLAGVILTLLQFGEVILARFARGIHQFLPVPPFSIALNGIVLGTALLMAEEQRGMAESLAFGLGGAIGWTIAIASFAALCERLRDCHLPARLDPFIARFFIAGFLSMAFLLTGRVFAP